MRKRQYRPRGSKKPRPLRLPLLNPKVSIHDAGSTHKKEPDVLILPEVLSNHRAIYTPQFFAGVHGVVAVFRALLMLFSHTFHAAKWSKQIQTMI